MTRKTLTGKILEFINEFPGATLKEIAEFLEISPALTRSLVYKLKNNGYIEKAGKGYVLTKKGEWFVQNILKKASKTLEKTIDEKEKTQIETVIEEKPVTQTRLTEYGEAMKREEQGVKDTKNTQIEMLMNKMKTLEEQLKNLETRFQQVLEELEKLKEQIILNTENEKIMKETKKTMKEDTIQPRPKQKEHEKLPEPIMSIQEARHRLGPSLDTLIRTGKVEIIGSLVVDSKYYEDFKKKFPLSIRDAEKLPPMEKRLLEEMNREAIVIIHAGKYYKLIK